MKENQKQTKGITLIALVITIIVLLILAGVSIEMLTGDNGILTQARNAKEETEKASELEGIQLAVIGSETKDNEYLDILDEESFKKDRDLLSIGLYSTYLYSHSGKSWGSGIERFDFESDFFRDEWIGSF